MTNSRLLIVEDESLVADDLQMRLLRLGYDVVGIADTAETAIEAATRLVPDLVLLDIRLHGPHDGVAVASRLKEQRIPFVYLTAHADAATLARTNPTEPLGFVVKPFDERGIHAAVETAMSRGRAERRTQAMERWFAAVLQSIGDGVLVTDGSGRVVFANPEAEHLTNQPAADLLGRPFAEVFRLVGGENMAALDCPVAQVTATQRRGFDQDTAFLRRQDAPLLPVEYCAAPILDDRGEYLGAVVVCRDATARLRHLEQHRLASTRSAEAAQSRSLSELASELAHDFDNFLMVILGNVAIGTQPASTAEARLQSLQAIEATAQAGSELCQRMMDSTGIGNLDLDTLDLDEQLRATVDGRRASLPDNIRVALDLTPGLPPIVADRRGLARIVDRLLDNATQALAVGGGTVLVRTGLMHATSTELAACIGAPRLPAGRYVRLEVVDTSPGGSTAVAANQFEPFLTAEPTGSGLSLASILGLVRLHHGAISCHPAPGGGTTLRVLLPAAEPMPRSASRAGAVERAYANGILVVEDDESLRNLVGTWLLQEGFNTVGCSEPLAALQILRQQRQQLLAVVLDAHLSPDSGVALLRDIKREFPTLPVLVLTGLPPQAGQAPRYQRVAYLAKPFQAAGLLAALDQMLQAPA